MTAKQTNNKKKPNKTPTNGIKKHPNNKHTNNQPAKQPTRKEKQSELKSEMVALPQHSCFNISPALGGIIEINSLCYWR